MLIDCLMKSFLDREELGGRALWGLIKEPKSGLGKEAGLEDPRGCLPPLHLMVPSGWEAEEVEK